MAEVVTGEAVVLDVPCAGFPSRLLARALDTVIQLAILAVMGGIVVAAHVGGGLDGASAAAVSLTVSVLVIVGYPVIWETVTRGGTPGKFALGLRVISDDGGPARFRQALVRGLAGVLEFWVLLGFPALLCSLLAADSKRIGDFMAGTRVIQRRLPRRQVPAGASAAVPPALAAWATSLDLASLSDATAETAREYLSRYPRLDPAARQQLGLQLAAAVSTQVSPPPPMGTPPADYLVAVLAERRRRATARLAAGPAPVPPPAAGAGTGPHGAGTGPHAPGGPATAGGFSPPL